MSCLHFSSCDRPNLNHLGVATAIQCIFAMRFRISLLAIYLVCTVHSSFGWTVLELRGDGQILLVGGFMNQLKTDGWLGVADNVQMSLYETRYSFRFSG